MSLAVPEVPTSELGSRLTLVPVSEIMFVSVTEVSSPDVSVIETKAVVSVNELGAMVPEISDSGNPVEAAEVGVSSELVPVEESPDPVAEDPSFVSVEAGTSLVSVLDVRPMVLSVVTPSVIGPPVESSDVLSSNVAEYDEKRDVPSVNVIEPVRDSVPETETTVESPLPVASVVAVQEIVSNPAELVDSDTVATAVSELN